MKVCFQKVKPSFTIIGIYYFRILLIFFVNCINDLLKTQRVRQRFVIDSRMEKKCQNESGSNF